MGHVTSNYSPTSRFVPFQCIHASLWTIFIKCKYVHAPFCALIISGSLLLSIKSALSIRTWLRSSRKVWELLLSPASCFPTPAVPGWMHHTFSWLHLTHVFLLHVTLLYAPLCSIPGLVTTTQPLCLSMDTVSSGKSSLILCVWVWVLKGGRMAWLGTWTPVLTSWARVLAWLPPLWP